ncbi:hypothetical protein ACFL6C_04620 [Myxococcota bacterium]
MSGKRTIVVGAALCASLACGDNSGCGGDGDYEYPRPADPADLFDYPDYPTALNEASARVRITQSGLDNVAEGVPSMLQAVCEPNPPDPSSSCAVDPSSPGNVLFYVGKPGSEVRIDSYVSLDAASMEGNVHMTLDEGRDGVQVTIGCDEDDFSRCNNPSEFVDGSVWVVLYVDLLLWDEVACLVDDEVPPGITIKSMQFTVEPRIELGSDLRPYLRVEEDDITVDRMEVDLSVEFGPADDPMCNDPGHPDYDPNQCGLCNNWLVNGVLAILKAVIETGVIAEMLSTELAQLLFAEYEDRPLDIQGRIAVGDLLPLESHGANPVGYLVQANTDSPDVTGSDALGLNFDLDSGFIADQSVCVPDGCDDDLDCDTGQLCAEAVCLQGCAVSEDCLDPRHFCDLGACRLPPLEGIPDPGASILIPCGDGMCVEYFDLAVVVGDVLLERALLELYDGGSFCLGLGAEELGEISGGQFVPSIAALEIVAPGLATLAPGNAPVDLAVVPRTAPAILFGSGEGEGEQRDSHFQMVWRRLGLEMYPLVDDTAMRAVAFEFTLDLGLSFEPTPTGDLEILVDRVRLQDVVSTYNEMNINFDPSGFADLVGMFLPALLSGDPINVALTAETLGFPFVPKLRGVKALGADGRHLGLFLRFCTVADISDPTDALCYEDPDGNGDGSAVGFGLGIERVAGPGGTLAPSVVRVRAYSDVSDLQLAYRVDQLGPLYSFRGPDEDGLFTLAHPLLATPGLHTLTVIGRDRQRPATWSDPVQLVIVADHWPPEVRAWRQGCDVRVEAMDDVTPAERVEVAAELSGPEGARSADFAPTTIIDAECNERVAIRARDDAGNVSSPVVVVAQSAQVHVDSPASDPKGCAQAPAVGWLGVAIWALRRKRSTKTS